MKQYGNPYIHFTIVENSEKQIRPILIIWNYCLFQSLKHSVHGIFQME